MWDIAIAACRFDRRHRLFSRWGVTRKDSNAKITKNAKFAKKDSLRASRSFTNFVPNNTKGPRVAPRPFARKTGVGLVAVAIAEQLEQQHEQVDEVQVKIQRIIDAALGGCVRALGVGILHIGGLDPLRVVSREASE